MVGFPFESSWRFFSTEIPKLSIDGNVIVQLTGKRQAGAVSEGDHPPAHPVGDNFLHSNTDHTSIGTMYIEYPLKQPGADHITSYRLWFALHFSVCILVSYN